MEPSPAPWISALRHSHDRLRARVEPLGLAELEQALIRQRVVDRPGALHLGSQAEIFGLFLDAGLTGQDPPGREEFVPIWDVLERQGPAGPGTDALRPTAATLEQFESLDAGQRAQLRLRAFGMEMDLAGVCPDAARRARHPHLGRRGGARPGRHRRARCGRPAHRHAWPARSPDRQAGRQAAPGWAATSTPERQFVLETGDAISLTESAGEEGLPELRLPAEALVRLVYGRLDPDHTPVAADSACSTSYAGSSPASEPALPRWPFPPAAPEKSRLRILRRDSEGEGAIVVFAVGVAGLFASLPPAQPNASATTQLAAIPSATR